MQLILGQLPDATHDNTIKSVTNPGTTENAKHNGSILRLSKWGMEKESHGGEKHKLIYKLDANVRKVVANIKCATPLTSPKLDYIIIITYYSLIIVKWRVRVKFFVVHINYFLFGAPCQCVAAEIISVKSNIYGPFGRE